MNRGRVAGSKSRIRRRCRERGKGNRSRSRNKESRVWWSERNVGNGSA